MSKGNVPAGQEETQQIENIEQIIEQEQWAVSNEFR